MYPISPEVYYQEYDRQVAAALLRQAGKAKTELADCGRVPWPKAGIWLFAPRARVELRIHAAE